MTKVEKTCEDMLAWQQAQALRCEQIQSRKDGVWYACLVAKSPRAAKHFADHELIASKLVETAMNGDEESSRLAANALATVASSGMLDGPSASYYRVGFYSLMEQ